MEQVYRNDETSQMLLKSHESFAVQVGISSSIYQAALKLWRAIYDLNPELEMESTQWFACMVLASVLNCRLNAEERLQVNFTTLLRKSNMTVVQLLWKMKHLRSIVSLSDRTISGFIEFQRRFCVTAAIFDRFENVYKEVFVSDDKPSDEEHDQNYVYDVCETKQACWLFYLLAKDEIPMAHTELFLSFQVLLCCIEFVMRATPKFLIQSSFDNVLEQEKHTVEAFADTTPVLKLFCSKYGCDVAEISNVKKKLDSTFFCSFLRIPCQSSSNLSSKCFSVDTVLAHSSELHARYWEILDRYFELDETLFLAQDPIVVLKQNYVSQESEQVDLETQIVESLGYRKIDANQETNSSYCLDQSVTDEIKTIVERNSSVLHPVLNHILEAAKGNDCEESCDSIYSEICASFNGIVSHLVQCSESNVHLIKSANKLETIFACCVIAKMSDYYRLPAIETNEAQQDDKNAMNVLTEMNVLYPTFVEVTDVFSNVDQYVSPTVLTRLKFVEDRILEVHMWKKGSSIYEIIRNLEISNQGQTTSSKGTLSNSDTVPKVLNKVCRLSYKRLQQLSKLLNVVPELQMKIWECIEECVFHRYRLLIDRHLDQIIMCSIYAICKVSDQERKFKNITQAYRKIPNTSSEVFKHTKIFDMDGGSYDSIIAFYNKVFMQTLKNFILQYSKSSIVEAPKQDVSAVNVLKRVNPNVLARNSLAKPTIVHPLPAITEKVSTFTEKPSAEWLNSRKGVPTADLPPLRFVASAIVAHQTSEKEVTGRVIPMLKSSQGGHFEVKKQKMNQPNPQKSYNSDDESSSESSEDENEARVNRNIYYQKYVNNRKVMSLKK